MSLQVPSYTTQFNRSNPLEDVYAWIASLACDFAGNTGRVTVNVHMDDVAASDGSTPIDQPGIALGQSFDTGEVDEFGAPIMVTFPTLTEILTDNAAEFAAIRTYLYTKLALLPAFIGSTPVA
jgi:hypothetical protein